MSRHDTDLYDREARNGGISVPEYDVSLEDAEAWSAPAGGQNLNYYQRVMQAKHDAESGQQADPDGYRPPGSRTPGSRYNAAAYDDPGFYDDDDSYEDDDGYRYDEDRRYGRDISPEEYEEGPGDDYDFGMGGRRRKKKHTAKASSGSKKKHKKKSHPLRTLFLLLLCLLLLVCGVLYAALARIGHVDPVADASADTITAADGYTTMSSPLVTNILLIGQDARSGEEQTRTDSMIICSIDRGTRQVSLVSLMRDSYVPIPGYGYDRLNAAYVYGGMELLDVTIQEDFGIDLNGNCIVDLDGFIAAMTGVGNVEIELTQEEADYMNANPGLGMSTDPDEFTQIDAWTLTAGTNSLTPEQTLCYCRMREVGNSDWDRTLRQRNFLSAAIAKFRQSDPLTQFRVLSSVAASLTTDMNTLNLITAGLSGLLADTSDMKSYQIPAEGTYSADFIDGAAVLSVDLEANRSYLKSWLYGE